MAKIAISKASGGTAGGSKPGGGMAGLGKVKWEIMKGRRNPKCRGYALEDVGRLLIKGKGRCQRSKRGMSWLVR